MPKTMTSEVFFFSSLQGPPPLFEPVHQTPESSRKRKNSLLAVWKKIKIKIKIKNKKKKKKKKK